MAGNIMCGWRRNSERGWSKSLAAPRSCRCSDCGGALAVAPAALAAPDVDVVDQMLGTVIGLADDVGVEAVGAEHVRARVRVTRADVRHQVGPRQAEQVVIALLARQRPRASNMRAAPYKAGPSVAIISGSTALLNGVICVLIVRYSSGDEPPNESFRGGQGQYKGIAAFNSDDGSISQGWVGRGLRLDLG